MLCNGWNEPTLLSVNLQVLFTEPYCPNCNMKPPPCPPLIILCSPYSFSHCGTTAVHLRLPSFLWPPHTSPELAHCFPCFPLSLHREFLSYSSVSGPSSAPAGPSAVLPAVIQTENSAGQQQDSEMHVPLLCRLFPPLKWIIGEKFFVSDTSQLHLTLEICLPGKWELGYWDKFKMIHLSI